MPTPPRAELPWPYDWDLVLGRSVTGLLWVAVFAVLGAVGAWLMVRATTEREPGFPLQYAPPDGLGPVQFEYIRTEAVAKSGLTATLFHLAERRDSSSCGSTARRNGPFGPSVGAANGRRSTRSVSRSARR